MSCKTSASKSPCIVLLTIHNPSLLVCRQVGDHSIFSLVFMFRAYAVEHCGLPLQIYILWPPANDGWALHRSSM